MRNKKRREALQQQINPLQWLLQQNPDIQIQEQKVRSIYPVKRLCLYATGVCGQPPFRHVQAILLRRLTC